MQFQRVSRATIGMLALAFLGSAVAPPAPAVRPVTETHYGDVVSDPYRYFEDAKDPGLASYLKSQSIYTRAVLDRLPGRAALLQRVAQLNNVTESLPDVVPVGRTYFYLKRPAKVNTTRLYARAVGGGTERVVFDPDRFARRGQHYTVDYFSPSPDGRSIAVGTSEGGSEETTLHVVDAASGTLLPDVIERAVYFAPSWRADSRAFYYFRTPRLAKNAPQSEKNTRGAARLHLLGRSPERDAPVLGYAVSPRISFAPEDGAGVNVSSRSRWALGIVVHGVQNELRVYVAPAAAVDDAHAPWRKIADYADDVTEAVAVGDTLYLNSHKGASRHRILALDLQRNARLAKAHVAVPQSARVIEQLALAGDGLYLRDLVGGLSKLRRLHINADGTPGAVRDVPLPFAGAIADVVADSREPGATFGLQSWTNSPRWYHGGPGASVSDTGLRRKSNIDFSQITSLEVSAPNADGTAVPLSIVMPKGLVLDGTHRALLDGYGAYGYVIRPNFSTTRLAWLERGGIFAECHPRGGGDFGEDWHFGAHIATKQRTIDDFIACARYLIDHRYTRPARLAGSGTSAGGVTIGNAIVTHPELWGAALDIVGDTNPVRDEFAEGGPANIPEFGSITNSIGWKALYATDPYVHIKDGVAYPSVLAVTGAHDPRVAPWIVAKFAARLAAATSSGKPILLRVDYDAGHGILGSSRLQEQALITDEYAFLLWQLRDPSFITAPAIRSNVPEP